MINIICSLKIKTGLMKRIENKEIGKIVTKILHILKCWICFYPWRFMLLTFNQPSFLAIYKRLNLFFDCKSWFQVSLSIFRKYSGAVDVWLSIIFSSFYSRKQIYCLLNNNPSLSFLAMAAHRSQWIWYVTFYPWPKIDSDNNNMFQISNYNFVSFGIYAWCHCFKSIDKNIRVSWELENS